MNGRLATQLRTLATFPYCPMLALILLWVVCNPFFAIDASSLIYSARTLADLDPSGVGRDIMFRFDGQSGFTIFTGLMRELASTVGLAPATTMVAASSVLAGFVGASAFAWSATTGRTRYLIVAFAATLPAYYGGYKLFCYAEVAATPRPFAEALVLGALAALLQRRTMLAFVLVGLAALLHPIMALGGIGVVVLWLVIEDRRWLILISALLCLGLIGATAGVRPFDRLWILIDPEWKMILIDRNPHLFPHLWPSGWIGRTAARVASLVIAAGLVTPPIRRLLLSALVVGAVGFTTAYVLTDRLGLLIVLQAQTWRTMWLVFALGAFAAAICTAELWPRGGTARLTLAFLALSWTFADQDAVAAICGAVAVGVHYALNPIDYRQHHRLIGSIVIALSAFVIVGLVQVQLAAYLSVSGAPAGLIGEARRTLAVTDDYTPMAIVAAIVILVVWPRFGPLSMKMAAASLCVLVFAVGWDQRSLVTRYFDSGRGTDDLAQLVASKPGEIYWGEWRTRDVVVVAEAAMAQRDAGREHRLFSRSRHDLQGARATGD